MKKISSFNLEENTYDEIIEYKEKYKLSSRNAALEMMLTERRTMLKMLENKSNKVVSSEQCNSKSNESIEENIFTDSIEDSFSSMPD